MADRLTRWVPDLKSARSANLIVDELMQALSIRVASGAVEAPAERGFPFDASWGGTFSGYASTIDPDHDRWVLPVSGFVPSMDAYMRNPVGLFNHDHSAIVFATRGFDPRQNGLHVQAQMDLDDEFARKKAGQVERGFLRAMSVGFLPEEEPKIDQDAGQLVFGRMSLLEISLVSVPANPYALLDSRSAARVARWNNGSLRQLPPRERKARGIGFEDETRLRRVVAEVVDERLEALVRTRRDKVAAAMSAVETIVAASLAADNSRKDGRA